MDQVVNTVFTRSVTVILGSVWKGTRIKVLPKPLEMWPQKTPSPRPSFRHGFGEVQGAAETSKERLGRPPRGVFVSRAPVQG